MADVRGPRGARLVAAAREILESDGPEALSMRRLADRMGVTAPSLYKHLPDKAALEHAIISDAFIEMGAVFSAVEGDAADPLSALGEAYRRFAVGHPHLYRLMTGRPLDRSRLAPGAEAAASAPLVRAVGGDADLARAVWAFAHGMAILEIDERFPPDADITAAWRRGIAALRPVPAD